MRSLNSRSPQAFDEEVLDEGSLTRYACRLDEQSDEGVQCALYAFAIGTCGHVQAAIYFDDKADLHVAKQIWKSFTEITRAPGTPADPRIPEH